METLLIFYLFFGALLSAAAIPLIREKIPPNGLYGFRVRRTMNDPEIWYPVNRHFGKRLFWIGVATVAAAILLSLVPGISLDAYALGVLAVFLLVFTVGLVGSWRYMGSL